MAAYREALKELPPAIASRSKWALTQDSLGNALSNLGEREAPRHTAARGGSGRLSRGAQGTHPRARAPQVGGDPTNLGTALRQALVSARVGTTRLEEAIAAFREALSRNLTREREPLKWTKTQNNLGNVLKVLGERESQTARLEEAVAAFREALKERTRERVPLDWAETQNNLGTALGALGALENGTARLEEAITAFREALEEFTRAHFPLRWARTQENLASAYGILFANTREPHYLDAALEAVDGALEEYRGADAAYDIGSAERQREKILAAKRML